MFKIKCLCLKQAQTRSTTPLILKADPVYKSVSNRNRRGESGLKLKESVQPWLTASLNDPIAQIIARNSHLSKVQLETLLIDILSENIAGKNLKYDEKARLRLTKAEISRGSFNRTLAQAKNNVIRSIYTILLLGYLGISETTTLDPYLEIANKLRAYLEAYKDIPNDGARAEEHLKLIETIRNELESSLKQLASPSKESL
jgi:hypothetical protein